jgi:hypothetical protein
MIFVGPRMLAIDMGEFDKSPPRYHVWRRPKQSSE